MAVTKHIAIRKTVGSAIKYITDKDKVVNSVPRDTEKALSYIADNVKTFQGELVYGHLCHPATASDEFELIKKQNLSNVGKTLEDDQGILAHHYIISFRTEDNITPSGALEYGKEMVNKLFEHHQVVIAVHTNTDNLHIHMIVNAHTTDPLKQYGKLTRMKYSADKESYRKFRDTSDRLCIEKGLSIETPTFDGKHTSWHENSDQKKGSTLFKNIIKDKIKEASYGAKNWEEYKENLSKLGVQIYERGNTISYRIEHNQMKRPMRESKLGGRYTKDAILEYINNPPIKEEDKWYYRENYPEFRVRNVSMTGKPKSLLELVLNLAIVILESKRDSEGISGLERWQINNEIKEIKESLDLRTQLGIKDKEDLKEGLTFIGKKLNNYKIEKEKLEKAINKNEDTIYKVLQIKQVGSNKLTKDEITQIMEELKVNPGLKDLEAIEKFYIRFQNIEDRIDKLELAIKEVSNEYRDLIKLKVSIEKAESDKYLKDNIEYSKDDFEYSKIEKDGRENKEERVK